MLKRIYKASDAQCNCSSPEISAPVDTLSMVWNIPLALLGQLSCLCPLPAACALPCWQSIGS